MQKSIPVDSAHSPEEIAALVLQIEHQIFPEAVKLMVENRLRVTGKRVEVLGE
jgi:phosphoribosylglycinamide formyltransferase-1